MKAEQKQYAIKGKSYPRGNEILRDFARECHRYPTMHDGYIEYLTLTPQTATKIAAELEAWGIIHGYNIKASQVNNSVIVEVVVSPLVEVDRRIDELREELNG